MKRILLVLLLITGSLFAQTFEQRYGLLQVPSIFKRLGTTISTVGTTDNVGLYTLALGGATIGTNALAVTGTSQFNGTNTANSIPLTIGNAYSGNNVTLAINGVVSKAQRINFQESGIDKWQIGSGAASESGNFEIYNSAGVVSLTIDKITNALTFAGNIYAPNGSAASPSYSFTSDPNSGMYSVGADQLGLAVNGSNMITVTTTGVGIGTTTPDKKLHVVGTDAAVFKGGVSSVTFKIRNGAYAEATIGTGFFEHDAYGDLLLGATRSIGDLGALRLYAGNSERVTILGSGNVGIATTNPLAKFHDNGIAMFGAGTGASLTDSSFVINYTSGSPVANWYGTDGDTWNLGINMSDHAVFSGATLYSFDNGITLADAGTSANSYAITLTADNATTPQYGSIQVMYGADPYLRISAPNDAGTATAIMDLKDQRVVIGSSAAGVDYDIYMQGETNQGTITYMEDEDRFDFDNDIKVGASLWGSAQMSGTDAFTTTATADTVTVTGATVNDIYILTYITAVTAAEAPLSVTATATGFIATRPAGTTSGASYAWMRQRK